MVDAFQKWPDSQEPNETVRSSSDYALVDCSRLMKQGIRSCEWNHRISIPDYRKRPRSRESVRWRYECVHFWTWI